MRLLIVAAFFIAVFSCASKEEKKQTVSDQIKVSLDTVMIDAGEEFLYLQDQLYYSALSNDKSYLINFSRQDFTTEKIGLEELRLLDKVNFEKEGPNGVLNVGTMFQTSLFCRMKIYFSGIIFCIGFLIKMEN